MPDFSSWLDEHRRRLHEHAGQRLERWLGPGTSYLTEAMEHCLTRGGKGYRPLLTLAVAETPDMGPERGQHAGTLDAAWVAECFHAASLAYDDLPAMDNAAARRGEASLHCRLNSVAPGRGAALAILAAHGLTALGFGLLARTELPPETRAALTAAFADAVGLAGMAGGQADELAPPGGHPDWPRRIGVDTDMAVTATTRKTAPLFAAAAEAGALCAGTSAERAARCRELGQALGEAYQLADDLRDRDEDRANGVATLATECPEAATAMVANRLGHARHLVAVLAGDANAPAARYVVWFAEQCEGGRA